MQIVRIYERDDAAIARAYRALLSSSSPAPPADCRVAPAGADIEIEGSTFDRAEWRQQMDAESAGCEYWETDLSREGSATHAGV